MKKKQQISFHEFSTKYLHCFEVFLPSDDEGSVYKISYISYIYEDKLRVTVQEMYSILDTTYYSDLYDKMI